MDRGETALQSSNANGAPAAAGRASRFRPDIEGLRALAVVPIVLNHAQVRGVMGGFVGVDIFFVISGYLITGILLREAAGDGISIARFYRRRILRIFPALFVLLAGVSAMAIVALTPNELVRYARSLGATAAFGSNFWFEAHTGYFDSSAETAPLLHTWSLAVEEQFYIFWPAIVALLATRSRRAIIVGLAMVSATSLAFAIWLTPRDMTAAFYLLPSRAWEFGIGGLLAALPVERRTPRWAKQVIGVGGGLALLYCFNAYRQLIVFPGVHALLPCLGAAALILAGPATLSGWGLSLSPVRFLGRISYSLYLWHWPVIVFTSLWLFVPQSPGVIAVQIALSVALAWASYEMVERRGRQAMERLSNRRLFAGATVAIAATLAAAGALVASDGLGWRYPLAARRLAQVIDRDEEATYRRGTCFVGGPTDRFDEAACLARAPGKPAMLLIGDSMAAHYWPGLARHRDRYAILQATTIGCPPGLYADARRLPCQPFFHRILTRWVPAHRPDVVVIAGYWNDDALTGEVAAALTYLRRIGQPAVLVGPTPDYRAALPRLLFFGGERLARANLRPEIFARDRQYRAIARHHGATYVSPVALMCERGGCVTRTTAGIPLQFDNHHATREGSVELVDRMMPQIARAIDDAHSANRQMAK